VISQTFTDRIAQAIGDPGSIAGARLQHTWGPETITRWSTRAVLATLTEPRLTDERQLLVTVLRHMRANGWTFDGHAAEHRGAKLLTTWGRPWHIEGKTGRVLCVWLMSPLGVASRTCLAVDVDSVREAVDLAVAYGMLPLAFSSAYRAGLDAAAPVLAVTRG
jgi:hypothetical protein